MILKLLLIIVLLLLYVYLAAIGRDKYYYFLTVFMLCVRELDVPYLGDLVPATVMIAAMFLGRFPYLKILTARNLPFFIVLFVSLIIGFMTLFPPDPGRVIKWALLLFNVLVLSLLTEYYIRDAYDLRLLIRCLIAVCLIFSISTIIGYLGYGDGTVIYNGNYYRTLEGNAAIYSSRRFGITSSNLVLIISVISICLIPSLHIRHKILEYLIIVIFLYAGIVTLKRMTLIAMAISILYYVYQEAKRKQIWSIFLVVGAFIGFLIFWWKPIMYRFGLAGVGTGVITDHSSQSRLDRIGFAIAAFKASPLLGMGAGYVTFIHNGFYEILGNCGIVGVVTIFLRFLPNPKDIISMNPWAVATVIYLITCFSLESAINHAQVIYFLGIFMGGYAVSKELQNEDVNYATEQ